MRTFFGKHYGWAIVAASFVYLSFTWGIVFNTNSLFLVPIEQSLAIGRAQTMVAITLRGVAMVIGAFVSGYLYDRYAFMRIFRLSSMLLVITYALIAAVRTPMQYYILSTLHIMFMGIAGFIPVTMMVNRWFAAKTGTAMGFALLGSAIGGMLLSPVAGWLIPVWGWRMVNLLFALAMFLVVGICTFFVFAKEPADFGLTPYGTANDGTDSFTDVIRPDPQPLGRLVFVLIIIGIVLMNASLTLLMTNTSPHLQAEGFSLEKTSLVMSIIMFSMGFGKIALGVLYDAVGMRLATLITAAAFLFGYGGLLYPHLPFAIWLSALGTGFGSTFNSLAPPIFARALYGVGQFTRINAFFQAVGGVGSVLAPVVVGALYDRHGDYTAIFRLFLFSIAVTMLIWVFALLGKAKDA